MGIQDEMSSDLSAFEARLSKLAPAEALDGGMLIFRAGQAAGAASRRRWQMLAAASVCVAVGAAMLSVICPRTRVVERLVHVQQESPPPVPQRPSLAAAVAPQPAGPVWKPREFSENSYFRVRQQVLEHGLSALPTSRAGSAGPQDARRLLDELLRGDDVTGDRRF
jgi:hypothetical protein